MGSKLLFYPRLVTLSIALVGVGGAERVAAAPAMLAADAALAVPIPENQPFLKNQPSTNKSSKIQIPKDQPAKDQPPKDQLPKDQLPKDQLPKSRPPLVQPPLIQSTKDQPNQDEPIRPVSQEVSDPNKPATRPISLKPEVDEPDGQIPPAENTAKKQKLPTGRLSWREITN